MDNKDYLARLQQANKAHTDCKRAPSTKTNVPPVTVKDKDEQTDTSPPKETVEKPKPQPESKRKTVAAKLIIGTVQTLSKSLVVKSQPTPAP